VLLLLTHHHHHHNNWRDLATNSLSLGETSCSVPTTKHLGKEVLKRSEAKVPLFAALLASLWLGAGFNDLNKD